MFIDFQIFSDHKIAKKDGHKVKLRMELRIVNVWVAAIVTLWHNHDIFLHSSKELMVKRHSWFNIF